MKTGFIWHERYMWHDTMSASGSYRIRGDLQPGLRIENAETKRKLKNLLDAYEVTPQLTALSFGEASDEELFRFHAMEYIQKVQKLSDSVPNQALQANQQEYLDQLRQEPLAELLRRS